MIDPALRRRGRRRGARIALIIALAAVFTGSAAYFARKQTVPATAPIASAAGGQVHTYTVRGRIDELPDPAKPSSTLMIQHEEIKNFARKDGTLGMSAMTMSFPYASGVTLDDLAVNDKVEFTLELNWGGFPIYRITRISKLPSETVLNIGSADSSDR